MKRYDQNMFIGLLLLCLLALFISCKSTRTVETVTMVEARDSVRTRTLIDTVSADVVRRIEQRDTAKQIERTTGTLRIERDSTGLPVFIQWDYSEARLSTLDHSRIFDLSLTGYSSTADSDSTAYRWIEVQKEEKKTVKTGPRLEDYIGFGLIAFVILYLIFVAIEKLWLKQDK